MQSGILLALTSTVVVILFYRNWRRSRLAGSRRLPLPPGPKPSPIVGNIKDLPTSFQWVVYAEWAKQYGDIVHVEAFGNHIIILDSVRATTELFEKRSSIYSDRPRMPMVKELMGWAWNFAFMNYGSLWRQHRRVFHQHFRPAATEAYQPYQVLETRKMLRRILETPDAYRHHVRHMAAATIMRITYGIEIKESDDPYIVLTEEAVDGLSEAGIPGAFLVDVLPILKFVPSWLPGASFQKKAQHWAEVTRASIEMPFHAVKAAVASGTALPCFATTLLNDIKGSANIAEDEVVAMSTTGVSYAASVDTTANSIYVFVLVMLLYPEVQKKAQAELDAVVGPNRLPDFSDKPALPYVDAVVKETLRWHPVVPLGVVHANVRDDEYSGYRIPKGAFVMGNTWSILHNEATYPEPFAYRPERFLKDGKPDPAILDPDVAAFGFGRRICPGRHLAMNSIFIMVASILAVYDITPHIDESGNLEVVTPEWTFGISSAPKPFRCVLTPRSAAAISLIQW